MLKIIPAILFVIFMNFSVVHANMDGCVFDVQAAGCGDNVEFHITVIYDDNSDPTPLWHTADLECNASSGKFKRQLAAYANTLKAVVHTEITEETGFKAMFKEVADYWNIPQAWAEAISMAESRQHPWALNIEGVGYYFETKEQVLAAAEEAWAAGQSFDVGLMQVNSFWLKKYNIPLEAVFDPLANIYMGGYVLKEEIKQHGLTAQAIGAYHSPNPDRARRYAETVLSLLENPQTGQNQLSEKVYAVPVQPQVKPDFNASALMLVQSTKITVANDNNLKVTFNADEKNMKVVSRTYGNTDSE